MAERRASWYLIQFTPDLKRREPRNVGVVLESPQGWLSKFYANDRGQIDGRRLRKFDVSSEAYGAWVDYYTRSLDRDSWSRVLESKRRGNFEAIPGGHIYEPASSWSTVLESLYAELVESDHGVDVISREPVDLVAAEVLRRAEILAVRDFATPVRYGNRRPETVTWDFSYQNGSLHLMDSVRLSGRQPSVLAEAFYARAEGASHASSERLKFVCFFDGLEEVASTDHILAPIEAVATVVDLSDLRTATQTVLEALGG